jgi:hypothetical protein
MKIKSTIRIRQLWTLDPITGGYIEAFFHPDFQEWWKKCIEEEDKVN